MTAFEAPHFWMERLPANTGNLGRVSGVRGPACVGIMEIILNFGSPKLLETEKKSFRHSRIGGNPGRRACCLGPSLRGDDRYLRYL